MGFNLQAIGGFGTGSLGDVTLTGASCYINSHANVTAIASTGQVITIGASHNGVYGGFTVGQEIMFHVTACLGSETANMGKYAFARILAVNGSLLTLDKAVPSIDLTKYICQAVTVPNFNNLTIGCQMLTFPYDVTNKYGGILILKAKGTFNLSSGTSMLIAEGAGLPVSSCLNADGSPVAAPLKPAGIILANSDIKDRLVMPVGSGIIAVIANNLKLSTYTRLGGSWDGSAGTPDTVNEGGYKGNGNGKAGLGGNGGSGSYANGTVATSAVGGIGAQAYNTVGFGGQPGYHGGPTYCDGGYQWQEGTGSYWGDAGAVVMLLANTITGFDLSSFCTGGRGGWGRYWSNFRGGGGGGAGFGYIATNTASFPTNTVAYALDALSVNKRAMIQNKKALDCSKFTSVDSFTITGNQPAGSDRKLIFSLGAAKVAGSRTYPVTTNAVAGDTVTIAGVTLTAVASTATPSANQFCVGATVAATAANIASALNLNNTVNAIYAATADASGNVILSENSSHVGYGNTPAAATKTGTIVFGTGTVTTSVPTWFKLTVASGVASMVAVATQIPTVDSVLAEGNATADLTGITSIPAFVGQQVYATAALTAPYDAVVMPTLAVTLNGHNNQDQYQKDELSAEYALANTDVDIVSVTADVSTTGQGAAVVQVSLKQSGSWSGWMTMLSAKGQKASAIKYKATYTVSKLDGTDSAKVNSVAVIYCAGTSTVSGDIADILTVTQDYENGLSFAQCLVKHKELMDAQIKAFVSFRSAPKKRMMLNVGTGNGQTQTVKLGVKDGQGNFVADTGINHNTLGVQFDSKPAFDYGFNTETSELTFTAANGVAVTASYEYGWEQESWLEMTAQDPQPYNDSGTYATKFTYTLPSNASNKTISDVKVQLYRPSGHVDSAALGIATGQRQLFVLPHFAKKETINCNGAWSYDDNSRILTVVADKNTQLTISYDWIAETQEIYGLTAGWAE